MKKYLINGALALIVGFTYTSCKNNDVDYVPIAQQKTQAYAEAFKEMIGGEVDPNQNWGFETITISEEELAAARAAVRAGSRAGTRAENPEVVKKDVWKNFPDKLDGNTVPPDVTTDEADYVYKWFQNNPGLTIEGRPWSNFFLQQVYGTMNLQKKGIWHRHDINPQPNGRDWEEEFQDKGGMDYLTVGDGTTMTHVNDFNAESGGPWNIVYMKNSSALQFGYHSTWDNSERQRFKLAEIEVPGSCFTDGVARKGWYVGLSLLAEKYDNGKKVLGEQRKDYGDDWILKVVPGEGETEITNQGGGVSTSSTTIQKMYRKTLMLQGRVFCEDLAKATRADIDFNDIVFDARIWKITKFTRTTKDGISNDSPDIFVRYEGEICLLAAGGTIPAKVAYKDVHELFGVGLTTMVNTVDGNSDVKISWENSGAKKDPVTFTFDMTSLITQNSDKVSLNLIPIEVLWTSNDPNDASIVGTMQTVGNLDANVGNVPYKFCVPIGTPWASERNPITLVYSGFADWAKKTGNEPSWTNGVKCYNQNKTGLPTDSKYQKGYWEVYKSEEKPETTTTSEIIFWKGSSPIVFADNDNGSNKTIEMIDTYNFQVGDKIRVYTTGIKNNAWISVHGLFNNDSQWRKYLDFAPSGEYNEFTVDQSMLNNITKKIAIWGRGCSITQISRWRQTVQ